MLTVLALSAVAGCRQDTAARLLERADRLFEAQQFNAAYAAYKQVLEKSPKSVHALLRLADCSLWLGDSETGLVWVDKVLRLAPHSAPAWEKKGEPLLAWRKPREAIKALDKALALDGQMNLARLNLSIAYQTLGDNKKAVSIAEQAVDLDPKDPEPHFRLAAALQAARRTAEAEAEYRRTLALKPDHRDALMSLSRLLVVQRSRLAEARQLAQKRDNLDPGNGEAAVLAAWALYLSGDHKPALQELEQVARAHPSNFEAWLLLSKGLNDMGLKDAGRKAAAMALQVSPRPPLFQGVPRQPQK